MCLLIHGEFTGTRSPVVLYGRCVYSYMETLLVSGVQKFQFTHSWRVYCIRSPELSYGRRVYSSVESLPVSGNQNFHMDEEDAFTHPWRVYWYQESKSSIWKMCFLIHEELLFTFISVSLAFTPWEDVVTYP
jgi:hypothetical protein